MAISIKVGTFNKLNTALTGGTSTPVDHDSITGIGFQPKGLLLFSSGSSSALTTNMRPGMGVSSGSTGNRSICWGADTARDMAVAGTNSYRRVSEDYCFMLGAGSSVSSKFKVKTFNAGGSVTFTYDHNDTSAYPINYVAVGGADITNVKAGSFNLTTATGNLNVTSVGFSPDLVIFFGGNDAPLSGAGTVTSTPHAIWFLGAATSSQSQNVTAGTSLDAVVTSDPATVPHVARYQRTNECIAIFAENSVAAPLWAEANYVGALSNGFTINVTTAPASTTEASARPIFYIAIKGGSYNVGNFAAPINTGGNQTVTTSNYTPKGAILYGNQGTGSTTISTAGARFSFGAMDATSQWNILSGDDSVPATGTTTTETVRGHVVNAVYKAAFENPTPDPLADIRAEAAFSSFNSGNFIVNWSKVDTNDRQVLYISAGDSPAGAALVKIPTAETIGITETATRRSKKNRRPTTETIGITEGVVRRRGLIRLVGGPAFPPVTGGFTTQGFTDTGFITGTGPGAGAAGDYQEGDFLDTDYFITGSPLVPGEGVGIFESVVKKLTPSVGTITAANIIVRYSGGASYNGATDKGVLSVGGAISNTVVANDTLNSAWDDVAFSEATSGESEVRCFYLLNTHPTLAALDVRMWIDTNTPAANEEIQIVSGASAANTTETAVANENTIPSALAPLFSTAPNEESAVQLGDIPANGGYKSFWIKRIVSPNAPSSINNFYTLMVSFASNEITA